MKTFVPDLEDDELDTRLDNHTYCPNGKSDSGGMPLFIIFITLCQIAYFIYMYKFQYPDPIDNWNTWNYQFNQDKLMFTGRQAVLTGEYWRFFTYSFVHCGLSHIIGNVCFQLIIGIPLEYVHGSFRVGLLYCIGVVVGSMTSLVVTPETYLVGASGGDFCLVSAVLANCILNCDSMHKGIALIRFVTMGGYIGYEAYCTYQRFTSDINSQVSWAAHMGGAVTGLFLGVVMLRNREKKGFERCFTAIGLLAFVGYVIGLVLVWFMIVRNDAISSIMDISIDDFKKQTETSSQSLPNFPTNYEDLILISNITITHADGTTLFIE